ncbi:MAG: HAD-IA family hydrolase [Gemmatimonadaceae bacterium]
MMTQLALLFDLDGTLIDSIGLLVQSMEFAFADRENRPTVASWTAGIGKPLRIQIAEWATDSDDVETLVTLYREFQHQHLERLTTIYPHVVDVLQFAKARGHRLALVTSKGLGMTERSLAHVGLAGMFDVEVTVESTERHKPLPDPVLFALEQLNMPASHAVFVGDSTHDMHAGRAANVKTAAAKWGPFSSDELRPTSPDFWLDSMLDLKPIIEQLEGQSL